MVITEGEARVRLEGILGTPVWVWMSRGYYDDVPHGSRKFHSGAVKSPMFLSWEEAFTYAESHKDEILVEAARLQAIAEEAERIYQEAQTKRRAEEEARRETERLQSNQMALDRLRGAVVRAGGILKDAFGNVDQEAAVRLSFAILNSTQGTL